MKRAALVFGTVTALGVAGCVVYVDHNPPPASPPRRIVRRRPPPPPAPAPVVVEARPAPVAGRPAPPPRGRVAARPTVGPRIATHPALLIAAAESKRRLAVRSVAPPRLLSAKVVIKAAVLAKLQATKKKGCAPFSIAGNTYAKLDCRRYAPLAGAHLLHPALKINLYTQGRLRIDPPNPKVQAISLSTQGRGGTGEATTQSFPGTVDHRTDGTEGPVKDQGVVGSCSAFSLSTVMDNAIRRLNKTDSMSSEHLWSRYGIPEMSQAASANLNQTITGWPDLPYDQRAACEMESAEFDDCSTLFDPPVQAGSASHDSKLVSAVRAAAGKAHYKIGEVAQISPIDPNVLASELAMGKDIWLGIGVGVDAWTGSAVQQSGVIPDYSEEDGGHAVALAGYRTTPTGRQFLVHNSWGEGWAQGGYAWISENMIKQHSELAYTIQVSDTAAPAPPPTPLPSANGGCVSGYTVTPGIPVCQRVCTTDAACGPGGVCVNVSETSSQMVCVAENPLTDDDCGSDDLVDAVTGLCAPACGNGSRPAAGQC